MPAARTRTSTSPRSGAGSGRSATSTRPSTTTAASTSGPLEQRLEQGAGAVPLIRGRVLGGDEVGGARGRDRVDLFAHGCLVADDGHVGWALGTFLVEHGPVRRQLPVDREHLRCPGAGR